MPDTPFAAKRDFMRNILRMKTLAGKFIVLLTQTTDMPPAECD
jgi:hypothetical protein